MLGVALFCAVAATAQPMNTVPQNIRAANTLDNLSGASGLSISDNFFGIPLEPGRVRGSAYLHPEWKRTTFLLYDAEKMVEGFPARYEIDQDQFEIKTSGSVKVLSGKKVRSFVWIDTLAHTPHYFVNGRDFKNPENVPLSGFFEVLIEGPLTLVSKTKATMIKPSYNHAFDMGNRDARIVKKDNFFYLKDGVVGELPSSRKKLLPLFGAHASGVNSFIKVNALRLDDAAHLRAIFEHYNTLLVTN